MVRTKREKTGSRFAKSRLVIGIPFVDFRHKGLGVIEFFKSRVNAKWPRFPARSGLLPRACRWYKLRACGLGSGYGEPMLAIVRRIPCWVPLGAILIAALYAPTLQTRFDFIDDGNLVYPTQAMPL